MKFRSLRVAALLFFISFLPGHMAADQYISNEECCRPTCCYECGCNPLYCGALDFQIQAGVAPILWRDRGFINFIQCPASVPFVPGTPAIFTFAELPKFSDLYRVPWIVGAQIGYAVSDNIRVYLEVNYLQSRAKNDILVTSIPLAFTTAGAVVNSLALAPSKYKLVDAYLGARYYFDRICDKYSFFVGFKAGVVHYRRVNFTASLTAPVPPAPVIIVPATPEVFLFDRHTAPSGGLNFGLDICFCGCWSLVVTGEVVASCGPHGNENIAFNQAGGGCAVLGPQPVLPAPAGVTINNLIIGGSGTELRFPITAAIRYSF